MRRITATAAAVLAIVGFAPFAMAQTGIDAPDVARRQTEFVVDFDHQRSLTGVLVWVGDRDPIVESAQVQFGEQITELIVVPPSVYVDIAPGAQSFASPIAAFDVYELSEEVLVIIGDSTFGGKAGPFEPFFAGLEPNESNDGSWASVTAFGLWGTVAFLEAVMPDNEPSSGKAIAAEDLLPVYTCDLDIQPGDQRFRIGGVLPNGKPVYYLAILTESGELLFAVVCPEVETSSGLGLAVCQEALPVVASGPGNVPTISAAIFRLFSSTVAPAP